MRGRLIFLVIVLVLVLIAVPYYQFLKNTLKISIIKTVFSLDSIRKINNQVNILILGIPGGKHEGPLLSDSIVVVNYDFSKNRLLTIGIPRDIWSDTLQDRINSAYAYGEGKTYGGGLRLAKAEVGSIIGIPIQYGIVINFSQFKQLIDSLGGVEVDIQRSFIDEKFPIEGKENSQCGGKDPDFSCRYETVSFSKGKTHMDGTTTLKFVRSRNAQGEEGSDFARTQRQQQILDALKDKIIGQLKSLNINNWEKLYLNLDRLIIRDLTNQQGAIMAKNATLKGNYRQKDFHFPRDFFTIPDPSVYYGKYVLVSKNDDFTSVHKYFDCLIEKENEKECLPKE